MNLSGNDVVSVPAGTVVLLIFVLQVAPISVEVNPTPLTFHDYLLFLDGGGGGGRRDEAEVRLFLLYT